MEITGQVTILGQILTIAMTLLAIGSAIYIAHRIGKTNYAINMTGLQRLELSAKIGLPIAFILIIAIVVMTRIIK